MRRIFGGAERGRFVCGESLAVGRGPRSCPGTCRGLPGLLSARGGAMGAWAPLCLLSAALAAAASGACVYQGLVFENNTIWKPDSCQECRCRSNVITCEPIVCRHPQCDFQKGEVLQIAPNKCCPDCASRAEGFCQHEGQIHSHGTQWASSGCVLCSCAHGKVNCTHTGCPALACGRGELQYTAQGACCPTCVGLGGEYRI